MGFSCFDERLNSWDETFLFAEPLSHSDAEGEAKDMYYYHETKYWETDIRVCLKRPPQKTINLISGLNFIQKIFSKKLVY